MIVLLTVYPAELKRRSQDVAGTHHVVTASP